jgi:hypothetical protein
MNKLFLFPLLAGIFLLVFFPACKHKEKVLPRSENNIDAVRHFLLAALKGDFQEARRFMLTDSVNLDYLEIAERSYKKTNAETKRGYLGASIHIHQIMEPVKDSIMVVIFSNSFMNDHDTLKVLKVNDQWLVDLKYLYEHPMDTTIKYLQKDSIPQP